MKAIESAPRERHERRICAGDWVRLTGSGPSVRGLGKVVEGDYDAADGALRCARVEFARGSVWFSPGDLRRIDGDEERRLVQEALGHARMPEPAAQRLREALFDPERVGRRSPGLLDLLWSLMGSLPNERAVSGLARFFDEGGAPHARTPVPAPSAPAPRAIEPAEQPTAAYEPSASWASLTLAPGEVPKPWPAAASAGTILERALGVFNHAVLARLADLAKVPLEPGESAHSLRAKLAASELSLATILGAVTENQLRQVARALRVPSEGEPGVVRSVILALAAMQSPAGAPPCPEAPPTLATTPEAAPPSSPPGTRDAREAELIERVLAALELQAISRIGRDLHLVFRPRVATDVHRLQIKVAAPHLGAVIAPLTDDELRAVACRLGVETGGARVDIAGRILALAAGDRF